MLLRNMIVVFLGGGSGSVLRWLVQELLHERLRPGEFPWATFTVNVVGSFMIGLFYGLSSRFGWSAEVRLLLTAGFCGGFTTFSTFSNDGIALLRAGQPWLCLLYLLLSVSLGLISAYAAARLTQA